MDISCCKIFGGLLEAVVPFYVTHIYCEVNKVAYLVASYMADHSCQALWDLLIQDLYDSSIFLKKKDKL